MPKVKTVWNLAIALSTGSVIMASTAALSMTPAHQTDKLNAPKSTREMPPAAAEKNQKNKPAKEPGKGQRFIMGHIVIMNHTGYKVAIYHNGEYAGLAYPWTIYNIPAEPGTHHLQAVVYWDDGTSSSTNEREITVGDGGEFDWTIEP